MVTTELRFFWKTPFPEQFTAMSGRLGFNEQVTMEDYYLEMKRADKASVKWRRPNLEVKALVNDTMVGKLNLQVWEKNLIIEKGSEPTGDNWTLINKRRHLLYWNSDLQRINEPRKKDNKLYCQIELSEATVNGSTFTSMCFECGGKPYSRQGEIAVRAFKNLLNQFPWLEKMCEEAYQKSYAAFILELHFD